MERANLEQQQRKASGASNKGRESHSFPAFLLLTAGVCGAVVMVLEVLGSRVLGPFFGVSLFVWTSLIAVALIALALGYAAGGWLADRKDDPSWLYGMILVSGLCILTIPYLKSPVLKACMGIGLRAGSLAGATALFGPAIFLLGCVSPFVVKIAAREARTLGRTVGLFYAVSTIGSFLGTLLTGFVFLAYFRADRIFQFLGITLVAVGAAYFLLYRKRPAALALLAVALILPAAREVRDKVQPNGTRVQVLHAEDTYYGNLKVVEYSGGNRRFRELMIDGLIQGGIDMDNGLSSYQYPYLLQFLPYGTNPRGKTCLVLGLGAGVIPRWYEARGIRTDVVDINPVIPSVARDYFGFRSSGDVAISDARYYMSRSSKRYDYIILDVANGDWGPAHILSLESFLLMQRHLTQRGILAINLIGSLRAEPLIPASVARTLREVFPSVRLYVNLDPAAADIQNLEVLALMDPALEFRPQAVSGFPAHSMVADNLKAMMGRQYQFPPETKALILTDDYNPADFYDLRVKEQIRKDILSYTDWDVLL